MRNIFIVSFFHSNQNWKGWKIEDLETEHNINSVKFNFYELVLGYYLEC